ncbi:MAG: hypothetical protein TRG1_112 [Flavobacteriaceae bacterium FS1-H7996/R]|nr:MAG: hypothetical protein TRG1_112 [Flavobacteriaceae bacterium FS1-H7996/R]
MLNFTSSNNLQSFKNGLLPLQDIIIITAFGNYNTILW